jgi:hypothetical protein
MSHAKHWAGRIWGASLAPAVALISGVRHSRMFHPRGVILHGRVRALPAAGPDLARLSGRALVRFSGAWWKRREWPDVLGCAVRFRSSDEVSALPAPGDQDLLLATIKNPWTTLLAPLSTRHHDYLTNDYFGVSPFALASGARVKFRLRPTPVISAGKTRAEKLSQALQRAPLILRLAARSDALGAPYVDCAEILLDGVADVNDDALRFDPFRAGRGIRPIGLVHHARIATYASSRRFSRTLHADTA